MPPTNLKAMGLDGGSFLAEVPDLPPRIVGSIDGIEGVGKTWLACDAPGDVVYLGSDRNSEGVVKLKDKEKREAGTGCIIPSYFSFLSPDTEDVNEIAEEARPVRNKWVAAYRQALRSKARSVVVDSGGWVFLMVRLARFGTVKIFPSVLAAETNQFMQRLLDEGRDSGKTVLWIHRLKDDYDDVVSTRKVKGKIEQVVNSVKNGKLRRDGFKGIGFEMQMIIRLTSDAPLGFGLPLVGTVEKCTPNAQLVGDEFRTDSKFSPLRFATIASRAFADYDAGGSRKEWL